MKPTRLFLLIIILTVVTLIVSLPKFKFDKTFSILHRDVNIIIESPSIDIPFGSARFTRDLNIKKGLDLQGGTQLILKANMSDIPDEDQKNALDSVREVISRRVDLFGVSEPVIQTSEVNGEHRLLVELPGITDINAAVELIGQTAQLDFRQIPLDYQEATPSSVPIYLYEPTGLTGKDLKQAQVQFGHGTAGDVVVAIEFNDEGRDKFAEITKNNLNKPVAIFLDEYPITAPIVQAEIIDGRAVISGSFDIESAKQLSIQLNAGALPVPIEIISQSTIGPTLGAESVQKSIIAGLIGLLMVIIFMVSYYGYMGVIASAALIIYGLITLTIYKLVPITLTLPGIAGFILSVGMAVDSNILIFERMKEELRVGRKWRAAMELGFGRAWDSIKDANVATIITALILLNPLNIQWLITSGPVRGFALTLLVGVIISMFTGIVVTRTLMRVLYKEKDKKQAVA